MKSASLNGQDYQFKTKVNMKTKTSITDKLRHYLYCVLTAVISFFGLKFAVTQYKWGRKLYGGSWYLIWNWLPMNAFWSETMITSCGGRAVKCEFYHCR